MQEMDWVPKLCQDTSCVIRWLDGWQTMLGAAIAIPFAALAIWTSRDQERWRRKSRLAALRATMPLRLSQVSHYAVAVMHALAAVRTHEGVRSDAAFEKPVIPAGLADGLERTIEAIHDRRVVRRLSNLMAEMQVLDSRMSGLDLTSEFGGNVDSYLIQAATIHAQVDSLYDFARRRSSSTMRRIGWGDIQRAFMIARVLEATHPDVHAFVARSHKRRRDPEDNDPRPSLWLDLRMRYARLREAVMDCAKAK